MARSALSRRALFKTFTFPGASEDAWAAQVTDRINRLLENGSRTAGGSQTTPEPVAGGLRRGLLVRVGADGVGINPDLLPGDADYFFHVNDAGDLVYAPILVL